MSWSDLPLLPLCRVYQHLNLADVLSASSTCSHWRHALFLHTFNKDELNLRVTLPKPLEKYVFLANLFRHSVKDLNIELKCIVPIQNTNLGRNVLERFNSSKRLRSVTLRMLNLESVCAPDNYVLMAYFRQLCRLPSMSAFNLNGCGEIFRDQEFLFESIQNKEGFEILGLSSARTTPLISTIQPFHDFNHLKVLSMNYSYMMEELVFSMEHSGTLPSLKRMVINVTIEPEGGFRDLSNAWSQCRQKRSGFEVYLNCISLPPDTLMNISFVVLTPSLPLAALRVLFCNTINIRMLMFLRHYNETLKELHWADSILYRHADNFCHHETRYDRHTPNPLIMMCWRCPNLQSITLHGYWYTAHDLLGMARLRGDSLQKLSVSALIPSNDEDMLENGNGVMPFTPVCLHDKRETAHGPVLPRKFVWQMKSSLGFPWEEPRWSDFHPVLSSDCHGMDQLNMKYDYIINTLSNDLKLD